MGSEPIITMKNSLMILAMAMMMCQLLVQVSSQEDVGGDDSGVDDAGGDNAGGDGAGGADAAACTTIDHCKECPVPTVCSKCECGYMQSANDATCVEDENADCSGAAAFGLTTILLLPVALASIFSV